MLEYLNMLKSGKVSQTYLSKNISLKIVTLKKISQT